MNALDRFLASAQDAADAARARAGLMPAAPARPSRVRTLLAAIMGAAAGAIAAVLLDPARGRARRAQLADQGAATVRRTARNGGQLVRRLRSEIDGRIAAMNARRSLQARPLDDATLSDRVQSILFRDDSVPKGNININVERGIVVLRGEVQDDEQRARIVSEVESVEGVWSVRDLLHRPGEPAPTVQVPS